MNEGRENGVDPFDAAAQNQSEAERYRHAAEFMSVARETQKQSRKTLRGRLSLDDDTRGAITHGMRSSKLLSELSRFDSISTADQQKVIAGFEEMCRRRKHAIPVHLRGTIYRLLVIELAINAAELEIPANKIVSVTVSNGLLSLQEQFAEFRDTPWICRWAAVYNPADPVAFLGKVRAAICELQQDARFAEFLDTPWIFRHAAVNNSGDPAGFLEKMQAAVGELQQDARFAEFRDSPGIFRYAAVHNSTDPARFLEKMQAVIGELRQDARFAEFRDTPWIFRQAAVQKPTDPVSYLEKLRSSNGSRDEEAEERKR